MNFDAFSEEVLEKYHFICGGMVFTEDSIVLYGPETCDCKEIQEIADRNNVIVSVIFEGRTVTITEN